MVYGLWFMVYGLWFMFHSVGSSDHESVSEQISEYQHWTNHNTTILSLSLS